MELKLNVDSHQLSNEIKDLLGNLTVEQKQQIAVQMLSEAFVKFKSELDKDYQEQEALRIFNERRKSGNGTLVSSIQEAVKISSWQWDDALKSAQTLKQALVSSLVTEVVGLAKKEVLEMIKSDEKIKNTVETTLSAIKEEFPTYVKNAMSLYLAEQMKEAMSKVSASLITGSDNSQMLNSISQRLTNKGI